MALVNYTNEFGALKTIALYRPRLDEIFQGDPAEAMYASQPNPYKVLEEFDRIVEKFQSLGVQVIVLCDKEERLPNCPNMIYLRDVASVIDQSIVLANMKHMIRKQEPEKFRKLLEEHDRLFVEHVTNLLTHDSMEGADILITAPGQMCAYTGYRTGKNAVKEIADKLGLDLQDIPANIQRIPQHLLGGVHIIASDLLVRRPQYCKASIEGYEAIDFDETDEITEGFGMNIVTLAPGVVLMPSHCPEIQARLESKGVVCHTVEIDEIHKMGGGLACMTLPLKREVT